MKSEFVTYDIALRMEHLGFDEPCFSFYAKGGIVPDSMYQYGITSVSLFDSQCLRPTWQSAFTWFRDEHDLWICIQKYPTSKNPNRCYYEIKGNNINTDEDESANSYMSGWFDSYEEAELACLEKLCEIVEKQKIGE